MTNILTDSQDDWMNSCALNFNQSACLNKCAYTTTSNRPLWCDGAAEQYCLNNPTMSVCQCFDPKFNTIIPGVGITACFKAGCVNTDAYKTNSMIELSKNCPSLCANIVQIEKTAGKTTIENFVQKLNCPQNGSGSSCPSVLSSNTQKNLVILASVVLVIFIIAFAVALKQ